MRILYLTAILFLTLSSCTKWLDVNPKDIIAEDEMFKLGEGYRHVLNGLYRSMSTSDMYGKEMSWGMVDVMARHYKIDGAITIGHVYYDIGYLGKYTGDNVKGLISGMWTTSYNVIANANNLIKKVDETDSKKFMGAELEKNMILGEAIAVRGFVHFDMLRLFGKAPIKGMNELSIPYFTDFESIYEPKKTTKEVLDLVIKDLKKARDLVAPFDTLTVDGIDRTFWMQQESRFNGMWGQSLNTPKDLFYSFRGYRLNYIAITAALARVYNYAGMHDEAFEEASKVITFQAGDKLAFIFTPTNNVEKDRKLSSGVIFSLAEEKLYEIYNKYIDFDINMIELVIDGSYTGNYDDENDYRKTKLLTENIRKKNYLPNKHMQPAMTTEYLIATSDMLPMIRLSEMYYIRAEYYASKSNFEKATEELDMVRGGRNCKKGLLAIIDAKGFNDELIKDVRREFVSEGQTFYYYKKLNILPRTTYGESVFVLPLPENEEIN